MEREASAPPFPLFLHLLEGYTLSMGQFEQSVFVSQTIGCVLFPNWFDQLQPEAFATWALPRASCWRVLRTSKPPGADQSSGVSCRSPLGRTRDSVVLDDLLEL